CAEPVGICHRESRMARQPLDLIERLDTLCCRLDRKPFVDDQRVVAEAIEEGLQRRLALGTVERCEYRQRSLSVGHIVRFIELGFCERCSFAGVASRDKVECYRPKPSGALCQWRLIGADSRSGLRAL